jgi:hypothetical protein
VQNAWRAISDNDLWIAATTAQHARPLVTRNVRDFDNLPGAVDLFRWVCSNLYSFYDHNDVFEQSAFAAARLSHQ